MTTPAQAATTAKLQLQCTQLLDLLAAAPDGWALHVEEIHALLAAATVAGVVSFSVILKLRRLLADAVKRCQLIRPDGLRSVRS
jgi:hypothetical protein